MTREISPHNVVRESATNLYEKRADTGCLPSGSTFDICNIDIDGLDESEANAIIEEQLEHARALETGTNSSSQTKERLWRSIIYI